MTLITFTCTLPSSGTISRALTEAEFAAPNVLLASPGQGTRRTALLARVEAPRAQPLSPAARRWRAG